MTSCRAPLLAAALASTIACRAPDRATEPAVAPAAPALPLAALPPPGAAALVGAGDVADCTTDDDARTAALVSAVLAARPGTRVFVAGDNAYETGSVDEYRRCYLPTWGPFVDRTIAAPGNHDWLTADAAGYRQTFGVAAGGPLYHAQDVGHWRVIVVDSDCATGDACAPGSAQLTWLAGELSGHRRRCTAVIAHHPRFSSGGHGPSAAHQPLWEALVAGGADVVINGHDHHYERIAPLDAVGNPSPTGPRTFIVGTGGRAAYPVRDPPTAGSEVRSSGRPGVLLLTLEDAGFRFAFLTVDGAIADQGGGTCGRDP